MRLPSAVPALLLACLAAACGEPAPRAEAPERRALSLQELLGGEAAGFARALAPRTFSFPADHGPHPEFRSEWWYFVGHLADASGRRFGYQLTLFRSALAPEPTAQAFASRWRTRQAYMGHLSVTDVARRRFYSYERFARGALGLAGARGEPTAVWLEDWRVDGAATREGSFRLAAEAADVALDLTVRAVKPPVLQGDGGLSAKGSRPGNASYYYSLPRLETSGRLVVAGEPVAVRGTSWMDREWSTSALEPGQVGWDWFALQLDDGRELMIYRLRRADGSSDPASSGVRVAPDGSAVRLESGDFTLDERRFWTSPKSGIRYPAAWRVDLPDQRLELEVEPMLADQELRHSVTYWEGAVSVRGARDGTPVNGRGYVELTGYAPR